MVIVDKIEITPTRAYWHMNVALELQKGLEVIAVHEDTTTIDVLAKLVKDCVEQKGRNLIVSKLDEKIDKALEQVGGVASDRR